jgi:hypothetical protein
MRLIINIAIESDFVDAEHIEMAIPNSLEKTAVAIRAGIAAGSGQVTAPGVTEPMNLRWQSAWHGTPRGIPTIPADEPAEDAAPDNNQRVAGAS